MLSIDRLEFAKNLCRGKRVLDIGGQLMDGTREKKDDLFAQTYLQIQLASSEYRIVDYQNKPNVNYVLDLNVPSSIRELKTIINEYKPEVILCMEFLEHVNYHTETMRLLSYAIKKYNSKIFLTLPNIKNWITTFLTNWNHDHIFSFDEEMSFRFVNRSDLGKYNVTQYKCVQKYIWWWRLFNIGSIFQPASFGFLIGENENCDGMIRKIVKEDVINSLNDFEKELEEGC